MDTQTPDDDAPCPVAPRRPSQRTLHGVTLTDDYAWLKDANWQEVLRNPALLDPDIRAYLEAENRYTEAFLAPTQALQKTLVAEMRGRIKEDDSGVPPPDGPFAYLWKFREGGQHEADRPHAARRRRGPGRSSTAMRWPRRRTTSISAARGIRPTTASKPGAPTCAARSTSPSACAAGRPARTCPTSSSRPAAASSGAATRRSSITSGSTTITGRCRSSAIGSARRRATTCWSTRSRTTAGSRASRKARRGRFCIVATGNQETSERWLIDLADADATPRLVAPRETGVRYSVDDRGDELFILTNQGGAIDFRIAMAPLATPGPRATGAS